MDLVFEHVNADLCICSLIDPKQNNELIRKVVRKRDEEERPSAAASSKRDESGNGKPDAREAKPDVKIHASRTIINHVLAHGDGVLSSNAMADRRFSKG